MFKRIILFHLFIFFRIFLYANYDFVPFLKYNDSELIESLLLSENNQEQYTSYGDS